MEQQKVVKSNKGNSKSNEDVAKGEKSPPSKKLPNVIGSVLLGIVILNVVLLLKKFDIANFILLAASLFISILFFSVNFPNTDRHKCFINKILSCPKKYIVHLIVIAILLIACLFVIPLSFIGACNTQDFSGCACSPQCNPYISLIQYAWLSISSFILCSDFFIACFSNKMDEWGIVKSLKIDKRGVVTAIYALYLIFVVIDNVDFYINCMDWPHSLKGVINKSFVTFLAWDMIMLNKRNCTETKEQNR